MSQKQIVHEFDLPTLAMPITNLWGSQVATAYYYGRATFMNEPLYASGQIDKPNRLNVHFDFNILFIPSGICEHDKWDCFAVLGEGGTVPDNQVGDDEGTQYESTIEIDRLGDGDYFKDAVVSYEDGNPWEFQFGLSASYYVGVSFGWSTDSTKAVSVSMPNEGNKIKIQHLPQRRSTVVRGVYYHNGWFNIKADLIIGDSRFAATNEIGKIKCRFPIYCSHTYLTGQGRLWYTLEFEKEYIRGRYIPAPTLSAIPSVYELEQGRTVTYTAIIRNNSLRVSLENISIVLDARSLEGKLANEDSPWTGCISQIACGQTGTAAFRLVAAKTGSCMPRFIVKYDLGEPVPVEHRHCELSLDGARIIIVAPADDEQVGTTPE
jgi:hypothetical protein